MKPSKSAQAHIIRTLSSRERGQSLMVAVVTMFVLLFVGAIFVGLIARNLMSVGRSRDTQNADQFAQAGLRYIDNFLMNSPDGADWRPPLSDTLDPRDPDYNYLNSPDPEGAYTRVDFGTGRALIRVSYMMDPAAGKNLKIESVGRVGKVDPTDPTTYNVTPSRLRRKKIAYKAIALPDYLRYVTNVTNETRTVADIGAPDLGIPYTCRIGGSKVRMPGSNNLSANIIGSPMRFNCDVRFQGPAQLYSQSALDTVYTSGSFLLGKGATPSLNGSAILNSNDLNFDSYNGALRDGSNSTDKNGATRGITRLTPPLIDYQDPATGLTRYLTLTRDSGRLFPNTNTLTGGYALGNGIYIDNWNDYEKDTNVLGGQSLRSIYLNPSKDTPGWDGPYYNPPGVILEFAYLPNGQPGFRMVRADHPFNNLPGNDEQLNPPALEEDFSFFYYRPAGLDALGNPQSPVLKLDNPYMRTALKRILNTQDDATVDLWLPDFNGVIYTVGNIRVRGLVAAKSKIPVRGPGAGVLGQANPPAITIVSAQNIYIDGSLIREAPDSMIALLATNYVTVNSTQFLSWSKPDPKMGFVSTNGDNQPPYHLELLPGQQFTLDFLFGDDYTQYKTAGAASPMTLLMRHGSPPGVTNMNLLVNQTPYAFAAGNTTYTLTNSATADLFEEKDFPLLPLANGNTYTLNGPGQRNVLQLMEDPNGNGNAPSQDYLISRAVIVPMDVRIEAMIYAQNGSFFIIPGLPYNLDPNDTPANYLANSARPAGVSAMYPFYNQPIDCRITVVGAVAENRTASIADQTAWMKLWGYLPPVYGSSAQAIPDSHLYGVDTADAAKPAANGASQGLRYVYDPGLASPFNGAAPFRHDPWSRALPPAPRLPVCPGYVYQGDVL